MNKGELFEKLNANEILSQKEWPGPEVSLMDEEECELGTYGRNANLGPMEA